MRFFGGKENEATSVDTTQQQRQSSSNERKFGTPLRSNVDKSQRSVQSSLKKKKVVRVRTPNNNSKAATGEKFDSATESLPLLSSSNGKENTVVFAPGPVGLQLEPVNESPRYGCRVARFVDGGPNDPGQARKSSKISCGDLVLKVEAEGELMAATTYDEIINLLQLSHKKRIITVQSIWGSNKNISEPTNNNRDRSTKIGQFIPTKRGNSTTTKNRSSDKLPPPPPPIPSQSQGTPNSTIENDMLFLPPFQSVVHSSSEEEFSEASPIRNRTMLAAAVATDAPIIVDMSSQDSTPHSRSSSFRSQSTAKSSKKSMTPPSQNIADQFLLFDGFMGGIEQESSQVSSSSASSSFESMSIVEEIDATKSRDNGSINVNTPERQSQTSTCDDHCENTERSQIQQHQDLFELSLARADFEQRLQAARTEHSKTERELKDLYIHTCERNEGKIRQLVVDNDSLQMALDETKAKQTLLTDTRIKGMEKQVAELEKIRIQTQIEAGAKIKDMTNEYSRKMVTKEGHWSRKFAELDDEINDLREKSASTIMELDMSRTMIAEMESRILAAEGEKDDFSDRLQDAHRSIEELEESIHRNKEEDKVKEQVLQKTQERLEKVMSENRALTEEIESYDSFREESSVLTEKLANSVQEKQKVVIESQTVASKLETENENLSKQIDEKTSDVDQLLQEKLLLEDKLAQTWNQYRKAKSEASTVQDTLMEKLENGEYFTSADVEEKEVTIQSLSSEMKRVKAALKDELFKATKKSVNLHLQLRGVELKLREREESNTKIIRERDLSNKRIAELGENLDTVKNQILMVTEMYDDEKVVVVELKGQIEALSSSKEEAEIRHQKSVELISSELEAKEGELLSCQDRLEEIQPLMQKEMAISADLGSQVESITKSKEEVGVQYQKSIESISSELEAKKSELLLCQDSLEEMHSLNVKEIATIADLKAQVEALSLSKKEAEIRHQQSMESISSELESKKIELLLCQDRLEEMQSLKNKEMATSADLKAQVESMSKSKEEADVQYQKSNETISSELESTKSEMLSCRNRLNEAENVNIYLRKSNDELGQDLANLSSATEEADSHTKKMLTEVQKEIESQKRKVASTEAQRDEILDELNQLKSKEECLQQQIVHLETTLDQSEQELFSAKAEAKELSDECACLKTTENDLKRRIESLVDEKERLTSEYQDNTDSIRIRLHTEEDTIASLKEVETELQKSIKSLNEEKENIVKQRDDKIETLQAGLQSQCEELSCTEMRLQILEEDYSVVKSAQEKSREEIDILVLEKKNIDSIHQETIKELNSMLQSKQALLETTKEALQQSIDKLALENHEAGLRYRDDIEELTTELGRKEDELSTTQAQLKKIEDDGLIAMEAMEGLRKTIHLLTSENETVSTQYWESVGELTDELQSKTEELSCKQSRLDDLEEEIQFNKMNLQEKEQHQFHDLRETIASQTRLLDCSEFENSKMEDLNSTLQSRIVVLENRLSESSSALEGKFLSLSQEKAKLKEIANLQQEKHRDELKHLQSKIMSMSHTDCDLQIKLRALTQDADEKLELQKKCDDLNEYIADLEVSKEKISINYCSEIFRLVKRLAILESTHVEINEQRRKAMVFASTQLNVSSARTTELHNKLKHNLGQQEEEEKLIAVELAEKTKQLKFQNVMTSSLQAETSSILLLVKDLEESKEKEFNALKAITEGLQSALSSEKMTSAQSAADAFDARIELKILDNKYSLMLQSKDEALLKSENARTIMARNMLQANAVLASLRVQLNEKDHEIEDAMHDLRQTKEVAGKKLQGIIESKRLVLELAAVQQSESELREEIITQATEIDVLLDFNSTLKTDLEDKERNLDELTEELKDKEGSSCRLREDLQRVERDCQRHVTGLQRQVLSSRAAYVAKHIQNEKHIACFHQKENVAKEKIDNLHEANASLKGEMEKMNVTLNENKHQIEQLQKATGVLEIDILNEEGKNKEPESRKKTESKEKTQLLRNIECLSSKLISMEESQRQCADFEVSLKKNLLKLRAEYVSKHLEADALKKEIVILRHSNKSAKKKNTELNANVSSLRNELELQENSNDIVLENKAKELALITSQLDSLKIEKNSLEETYARFQEELKLSLSTKETELEQLHHTTLSLTNHLEIAQKQASEHEVLREAEAERMLVLEKEISTMAETISKKEGLLAEYSSSLESERSRIDTLLAVICEKDAQEKDILNQSRQLDFDKKKSQNEVGDLQERVRHFEGIKDEVQRLQIQCDEKERRTLQLEDEMLESERELHKLKDQAFNRERRIADVAMIVQLTASIPSNDEQTVRSDPPSFDGTSMSDHLNSVKDAFHKQRSILDDVKLSETVLQNFIQEAVELSTQAEGYLLELSSSIGTMDDLLLNPSSLISSLALEGLDSSKSYFDEVRSRLEDMASLAYTTGLELKRRQKHLSHWSSSRAESPAIPVTPPPSSKQMKKVSFNANDVESCTDNNNNVNASTTSQDTKEFRNKVAGARLLLCVMEKRNRTEVASSFRKWSKSVGAINASASHKELATELARELEITREKLMVLKSNLKGKGVQRKKPKLRRILERIENHQDSSFEI